MLSLMTNMVDGVNEIPCVYGCRVVCEHWRGEGCVIISGLYAVAQHRLFIFRVFNWIWPSHSTDLPPLLKNLDRGICHL